MDHDDESVKEVPSCPKCDEPYSMKIGQTVAKSCTNCDISTQLRLILYCHGWKYGKYVGMDHHKNSKNSAPACPSCGCAYSAPIGEELLYWCCECDIQKLATLLLSHHLKNEQPLYQQWQVYFNFCVLSIFPWLEDYARHF